VKTSLRALVALGGALATGVALDGGNARASFSTGGVASTLPGTSGATPGPRDVVPPVGATVAPTFAALVEMLSDPAGPKEIALLPQTYHGDLTIKRSVTIHGRRGAVLEGTGAGTVVTVKATDVVLRDVVVRHSGHRHTQEDAGVKATGERVRIENVRVEDALFGISLEECKHCDIERASVVGYDDDAELRGDGIKLWESNDSTVRSCVVERSRDVVVWYTRRATLENNIVRGGRYGTHFMYAHDATVRGSHL
jgi:nitrous oxidase accessory protein